MTLNSLSHLKLTMIKRPFLQPYSLACSHHENTANLIGIQILYLLITEVVGGGGVMVPTVRNATKSCQIVQSGTTYDNDLFNLHWNWNGFLKNTINNNKNKSGGSKMDEGRRMKRPWESWKQGGLGVGVGRSEWAPPSSSLHFNTLTGVRFEEMVILICRMSWASACTVSVPYTFVCYYKTKKKKKNTQKGSSTWSHESHGDIISK